MTLNSYFNNYSYVPEQTLLESLSTEMIQMFGLDVTYLRRTHTNIDLLFMEDPLSKFDNAHIIEMYMKSFMGYGDMSDVMSKFGMSTPDTLTLTVMRGRFADEFPMLERPREGDLIYVPLTNAIFEIRYVEHEDNFYQHGTLTYYDLKCERFKYSNETMNTGVEEIDEIETAYSFATSSNYQIQTEDGFFLEIEDGSSILLLENYAVLPTGAITTENGIEIDTEAGVKIDLDIATSFTPLIQNDYFAAESQEIIDWSETNPFGKN